MLFTTAGKGIHDFGQINFDELRAFLGDTVIVVEHDEDTIRAADHIVEAESEWLILDAQLAAPYNPRQRNND